MVGLQGVRLLLLSALASLILTHERVNPGQTELPTLTGRWQVEFTLVSPHRLQFDAQTSGEGAFLSLDPIPVAGATPTQTKATWSLRGQSSAIYYFVIAGDVEFPTSRGGIERGRLELSASSDLVLPISSLRGWGQFHSANEPQDGRGAADSTFGFTATRAQEFSVRITSPVPGQKLLRGKEVMIEWVVQSPLPIDSQEVLLSTDAGSNFIVIASALGGSVRDFAWTLPDNIPRTKKALIKVVAIDNSNNNAEGITTGALRIK